MPAVGFLTPTNSVLETQGSIVLTVVRTGDSAPFSVDYLTRDGSARAGEDYVAATRTLHFAEGAGNGFIEILILNDALVEATEDFTVHLSDPSGDLTFDLATIRIQIDDDDPGIRFSLAFYSVSEADSAVVLTVIRGGVGPESFTVDFATADGTAFAGTDYVAASGTLHFAENEASQQIVGEIINDALTEVGEDFTVRLDNSRSGVALRPWVATAFIRIEDNDHGIGFDSTWYYVNEAGGAVRLRVVRRTDDTAPFEVNFSTRPIAPDESRATPDADYVPVSGTLQFSEGENERVIEIAILNDGLRESEERFEVVLQSVPGQVVRLWQPVATVSIGDNDPGIHFDPLEVQVGEAETSVTLTVHRGADTLEPFTVDYATADVEILGRRGYQPERHFAGRDFPEVWGLQAVAWGNGRYVAVGHEWVIRGRRRPNSPASAMATGMASRPSPEARSGSART